MFAIRKRDPARIEARVNTGWLTRLLIVIIGVLASTPFAIGFDWDSYAPIDLDDLVSRAPPIDEGMDIFFYKVRFDALLASHSEPCAGVIVGKVLRMQGIETQIEVNHCLTIRSQEGKEIRAFIQDGLAGPLREDFSVGETVRFYVVYIYYSGVSKNLGLLVTGFTPTTEDTASPLEHEVKGVEKTGDTPMPNLSLKWTATPVGYSAWLASLAGTVPASPLRGRGVHLAR